MFDVYLGRLARPQELSGLRTGAKGTSQELQEQARTVRGAARAQPVSSEFTSWMHLAVHT